MINVFHNYRNHDLPQSNVLTVSQPRREKQEMVVNNIEIEIERERETAHLMKFGIDSSITFPDIIGLPYGERLLWHMLGWIRFGRELELRDVELRLPTITF